MIYLELFVSFVLIGFTSFGGLSMIPLISDQMISHGWMTAQEVSDIVAIAEMTPGSLGINCSTFAGIGAAGPLGAFVAALGVLTPTFTLCLAAAVFLKKYRESTLLKRMLYGIRPASVGMITAVVIQLSQNNYVIHHAVSPAAITIGLIACLTLFRLKWSVPKTIGLSAALGLAFGLAQKAMG